MPPSRAHVRAVVRPISRASSRPCARPGCPGVATATLGFAYADRRAWLGPLSEGPSPATYDLCDHHAARTRPPRGWTVHDDRPALDAPETAGGGANAVAVLATSLRRDRDGHRRDEAPPAPSPAAPATSGGSPAGLVPSSTTSDAAAARAPLAVRRGRGDA